MGASETHTTGPGSLPQLVREAEVQAVCTMGRAELDPGWAFRLGSGSPGAVARETRQKGLLELGDAGGFWNRIGGCL